MTNVIKNIVVTGNNISAWQTALCLRRLMPFCELNVTVLSSASDCEEARLISTTPTTAYFHQLLKINERQFMALCDARFSLAERYKFESRGAFYLAYAEGLHTINGLELHHAVSRIKNEAVEVFDDFSEASAFSLASEAAVHDRFCLPKTKSPTINKELVYGYTFWSEPYLNLNRSLAIADGVNHMLVDDYQWQELSGDQQSLLTVLEDEQTVLEADLFIDCSSQPNSLSGFQHLVAVREKVVASEETKDYSVSYDYTLNQIKQTLCSASKSNERYIEFANSASALGGDSPDSWGYLSQPWRGNTLRIGCAGSRLGDLAVSSLQLLQSSLLRLFDLFPNMMSLDLCAHEFNELSRIEFERVAEFHMAQLIAPKLKNMTRQNARMNIPEVLINKVDIFRNCGEFAQYESESISKQIWQSFFLKCGIVPHSYSPLLDQYPLAQLVEFIKERRKNIKTFAASMPFQKTYLKAYLEN